MALQPHVFSPGRRLSDPAHLTFFVFPSYDGALFVFIKNSPVLCRTVPFFPFILFRNNRLYA